MGGIRCHLKQVSCIPLELFPSFFSVSQGVALNLFQVSSDATNMFQCDQGLRPIFDTTPFNTHQSSSHDQIKIGTFFKNEKTITTSHDQDRNGSISNRAPQADYTAS